MCDSYCSLMKFWEQKHLRGHLVPLRVRNVICTMILATVGSHQHGSNRARRIQVVEGLRGLLITDAFVGVCCNPLKKLCQRVKKHLMDSKGSTKFKDTDYNGWVRSLYDRFPCNGAVCAKIIRPDWNPPTNVVERWIAICMEEMWKLPQGPKVVCL